MRTFDPIRNLTERSAELAQQVGYASAVIREMREACQASLDHHEHDKNGMVDDAERSLLYSAIRSADRFLAVVDKPKEAPRA